MFVEKQPQKKKFFDELARDSVIEGTRLRLKIDILQFVGYLFKSTERTFKDFTTIVHKFKVLDPNFFRNLLMNVKKRYPSWQIGQLYESDTEKGFTIRV